MDRNRTDTISVPRGLAGVVVADTSISEVRGDAGTFHYRGTDAVALARSSSFEQVWQLLVDGRLPDVGDGEEFAQQIAGVRASARLRTVADAVRAVSPGALAAVAATWSLLSDGAQDAALYDLAPQRRRDAAIAAAAVVPAAIALHCRRNPAYRRGVVADHLQAVTGREPDEWQQRALTAYLVLAMDHGFNASTFTARVIASTGASMTACLTGALGALAGPRHGGAPSRSLDALDSVDEAADMESWIHAELASGRRLMGFGHAVYRTRDPRAQLLKQLACERGGRRVDLAVAYEQAADRVLGEVKPGRALHANVELYAAVVMELCGIPRELMTATFAMARAVGWSAHVLEQAADPKIIRPASRYVGPEAA